MDDDKVFVGYCLSCKEKIYEGTAYVKICNNVLGAKFMCEVCAAKSMGDDEGEDD